MKVLIVCSKTTGKISPFIEEQANSIKENGIIIDYLFIYNKGFIGYFIAYLNFLKRITLSKYNVIHNNISWE
jgi:hypothetical protein